MTDRDKKFRVAIRTFGPFESAIAKAWDSFKAQEGIDLELEAVAMDLHPLYETCLEQEGLKQGLWDVTFLPTDYFSLAYESGALLDLAPFIRDTPPDDYPEGWANSLLGMQQFGDTIIGLPYHDGPECFIYRTDLFDDPVEQAAYQEQYGQILQVPQTWDEFHQIARFFNRPAKGLYGTIFAAYPDGHNTVYDFHLQLWTRGGESFDAAGNIFLDSPEAIDALEFYRMMLNDETAMHPQAREADSVKSGFAFAAGEIAMMVNWFGYAGMSETLPDTKVKGKVGVATIPYAPGGASASLNVYWISGVGAGSPHQEIAYKFLRHCATAAQDKMLTLEGAIGVRRSTWYDNEINTVIPFYSQMEALHEVARELPRLSNWTEIGTIIDQLVLDTINTAKPIIELTREAQVKIEAIQA